MSFSEIPPPPEDVPGQDLPHIRVRPPGPQSRSWLLRAGPTAAPMGPRSRGDGRRGIQANVPSGAIVYATAKGQNVLDVDGNRYVDLAGGFGAMLLGHGHSRVAMALELQSRRLLQALGDVHPSDAKIALTERLASLYPGSARVIVGQSGADAVSAALKTAVLATGRSGVLAFRGAYHGLSYGPLAACGLRASYREPFAAQLNADVTFVDYPADEDAGLDVLEQVRFELTRSSVGAVLFEPILGRGGVIVPPPDFLRALLTRAREAGAISIADEIWTGLGRAGKQLYSVDDECVPDLVCLGKGLGGGLPVSACVGREDVMAHWSREEEVVHTATFAGAPLGAATAIATLDVLSRERLVARSAEVGARLLATLSAATAGLSVVAQVRGRGMMIGLELSGGRGCATEVQRTLLERGYIVSTGGGARDVVVLTPALNIDERLLEAFVRELGTVLELMSL